MMIKHREVHHWTRRILLPVLIVLSLSSASLGQSTETQECSADGSCAPAETNDCSNLNDSCDSWQKSGECESNSGYMFSHCPLSCDVCFGSLRQRIAGTSEQINKMIQTVQDTKDYVTKFSANETVKLVWGACQKSLKYDQCIEWASTGECTANPSFMNTNCAAACQNCELLDINIRCPLSEKGPDVWKPGDLNQLYANLTTQTSEYYKPEDVTILSRPPDGPWVVTIDNFVSEKEALHLIALGEKKGYGRSYGVGGLREDGTMSDQVISGRTSSNAWCQEECAEDETAIEISDRISNLTGVPADNHEHFQLLKYEVGQFYYTHHDYISVHAERQPGPRILTVFLYLNDVEEGGGTRFPTLNGGLTVLPKRGRALIWPSVLDEDPHMKDARTQHEALATIKGRKYAANAWLHQRNYRRAHLNACQ